MGSQGQASSGEDTAVLLAAVPLRSYLESRISGDGVPTKPATWVSWPPDWLSDSLKTMSRSRM